MFKTEWSKCIAIDDRSETTEIELVDFFLFLALCSAIFGFSGILTLHEYRGPEATRNDAPETGSPASFPDNPVNYPDIRDYTALAYEYGESFMDFLLIFRLIIF